MTSRLAAADGVNDLYPVAVTQQRFGMLTARHYIQVQLNRQTLTGQAQYFDQISQAENSIKRIGFAIEMNLHKWLGDIRVQGVSGYAPAALGDSKGAMITRFVAN